MKYLAAVLALGFAVSLTACGKKGDLMPPPGYGQKATPDNGSDQNARSQTPAPQTQSSQTSEPQTSAPQTSAPESK